jgi:4-hydroxybenzoate polyprenyltransferase
VLDAKTDARHPSKRNRPISSGRVTPLAGLTLGVGLVVVGAGVGGHFLNLPFIAAGACFLLNSLAYCLLLKYRVIIDVISIAIGFVLRIIAGCMAIGVAPTSWILVCGFCLAMLLGFGKRRLEVGAPGIPIDYRCTLESYSGEKLNILLSVCASMCILSFMLYAVATETTRLHGSAHLVYTVPFVAYGVFRYLFKVQEGRYDGPVEVLLKDPVFVVNCILWLVAVIVVLYFFK